MGAKSRRKKPEVKENNRKRIEKIQESKKKQKKISSSGGDFHDDDGKNKNGTTKNNNNNRNTNGGGGGAFGAGIIEAVPILASYRDDAFGGLFVAMAYCKEMKMVLLVDDGSKKSLVVSVFGGGVGEKREFKAEDTIRAMAFSRCGNYFAVSGDDKRVCIFERKKGEDQEGGDFYYSLANTRLANKKVTSVTFTLDSKHIVYSDKYGDVRVSEVLTPVNDTNKDITTTTTTKDEKIDAEGGDAETGVFDKLLLLSLIHI